MDKNLRKWKALLGIGIAGKIGFLRSTLIVMYAQV